MYVPFNSLCAICPILFASAIVNGFFAAGSEGGFCRGLGEELLCRKLDFIEYFTGSFCRRCSGDGAIFAGNTIIICRNNYRNGTRKRDNREKPERYNKYSLIGFNGFAVVTATACVTAVAATAVAAAVAAAAGVTTAAASTAARYVFGLTNAVCGGICGYADEFCFKRNRVNNIE
jgi:hypothetical protein